MSLFRECNKPDEQFYKACLNGKTATVRKLLDIQDERLSRSATDPIYGYAHVPLYLACFGGHPETVTLLSERGADFSARCARPGNAPITGAASGGHVALIRLCLERGAEIDGRPESPDPRFSCTDTPLIAACRRLHLDSARVLLELGANVDEAGNNSDTPLSIACRSNRVDLVRLLITHGADLHGPRLVTADRLRYPLRIAIERFPASKPTVLALLEAGANPTHLSRFDSALFLQGVPDHEIEGICRLFCKWLTIMVRKHVIGPPAEHNGRRFEHLASHIASFVAPTGKFSWANTAVLPSDDDEPPEDVFYDSENDEYYDY